MKKEIAELLAPMRELSLKERETIHRIRERLLEEGIDLRHWKGYAANARKLKITLPHAVVMRALHSDTAAELERICLEFGERIGDWIRKEHDRQLEEAMNDGI